jgi:hypothetical protein
MSSMLGLSYTPKYHSRASEFFRNLFVALGICRRLRLPPGVQPHNPGLGQRCDRGSRSGELFGNFQVVLGRHRRVHFAYAPLPSEEGYGEIAAGAKPGRGLLYSLLVHEIIVFTILSLPIMLRPERTFREVDRWQPADTELTYLLPTLGGGHKGGGPHGGKAGKKTEKRVNPLPGPTGTPGPLYPGPQPIVSNPSNPTTRVQTILQPDIPNAPTLKFPIPLPNMVLVARAMPTPPPLAPTAAVEKVMLPAAPPEAPKLQNPVPTADMPFSIPVPPPPPEKVVPKMPSPPPVPEKAGPSVSAQAKLPEPPKLTADLGGGGVDNRNLLVLSPIPMPPESKPQPPNGELRGQFAIGPDAGLAASSESGSGSPNGKAGSSSSGIGAGGTSADDSAAEGSGAGNGISGSGSGAGNSGSGAGGAGSGGGSGVGSGSGYGGGNGGGTGSGAGLGPGSGPFPGISIVGGSGSSGMTNGSRTTFRTHPSYELTAVSTASSGGGLRDFGVFRNETVYTVYINMARADDPAPSWTLQYASLRKRVADNREVQVRIASTPPIGQTPMSPPFPTYKENPQFPPEVVSKNSGRMIVVYAVINAAGKLENIRIVQSPSTLLNQPLLEALEKWIFRPAEIGEKPVAVKALLGIPLALIH